MVLLFLAVLSFYFSHTLFTQSFLSLPLHTSFVKTNTPWQQKVLRIINTLLFLLLLFSFGSCMRVCIWHFFLRPSTLFELRYCLFVRKRQFLSCSWMNKKTGKTLNAYIYILYAHSFFKHSLIEKNEEKEKSLAVQVRLVPKHYLSIYLSIYRSVYIRVMVSSFLIVSPPSHNIDR